MSPVQVLVGKPLTCAEDGHDVVIRARHYPDGPEVQIAMSCARCGNLFLPASMMVGPEADWLVKQVNAVAFAPDAPPEAYEGLFS